MSGPHLREIELLRGTAQPLEALARRVQETLIGSGPWHASRCDDLMTDRCRCMVSAQKPGHSEFGGQLYIASAQTPELAQYLALFDPQKLALTLAFLMRSTAKEIEHQSSLPYPQQRLRDKRVLAVVEIAAAMEGGLHE